MRGYRIDTTIPSQVATELEWPNQQQATLPTLPGHSGFGMDNNGGGLGTNVYFVDSLATTSSGALDAGLGSNVWRCTWRFAWTHNHAGRHKIIIPLVSGWINFQNQQNSVSDSSNFTYWGQCAPGIGLFLRGCNAVLNGVTGGAIWHLASYMGDDPFPPGLNPDNRDCLQVGRNGFSSSNVLIINCELCWSIDETLQMWYTIDNVTCLYNAFINPLHIPPDLGHSDDPPGTDHGYGPLLGAGPTAPTGRGAFTRNLFAHASGRNPMEQAGNYAHVNNLHYNHGRPTFSNGSGLTIMNDDQVPAAVHTNPMQANVVGNMIVRGPNNGSTLMLVNILANAPGVPAGSSGFLANNGQNGWTAPTDQEDFVTGSTPANWTWETTVRSSAWPEGWGSDLSGTLRWAANPLSPTTEEKRKFVNLVCKYCGVKPKYRTTTSRIENVKNQILERINGGGTAATQMINAVSEDGGWFDVPEIEIADPTNPGTWWHEAPPLGSDRDDVLTSGTFSNGLSKAGYTKLVAWGIEQHYYVGGR